MAINDTMEGYRIDRPLRRAHFLAQLDHESGSLHYAEEIADGSTYESRRDLGNTQSGDGVKFKGRGLIQLTGRINYRAYGEHVRKDLTQEPSLVASDPALCVDVAGWYWDERGINQLADYDNIKKVTRKVNGGLNGLNDRKDFLERAKEVLT
jgi:putative chitinase